MLLKVIEWVADFSIVSYHHSMLLGYRPPYLSHYHGFISHY
jgi:Putative GTPase activating protein for Arf